MAGSYPACSRRRKSALTCARVTGSADALLVEYAVCAPAGGAAEAERMRAIPANPDFVKFIAISLMITRRIERPKCFRPLNQRAWAGTGGGK